VWRNLVGVIDFAMPHAGLAAFSHIVLPAAVID
jgi:hypothetical protein